MKQFTLLILLVVLFAPSCVTLEKSPVSGKKRVYGYSWDKEVEIGKEADQQIIAEYGIYDDEQLTNYVEELGQELLAVSHMRRENTPSNFKNTPFTFRVLDSPVVNAFALPGGYVYVTRGLLGHLENEAQLAVVLGHEIGHVAARHASQRAAEQQLGQIAIIGGAVVGQGLGYDGASLMELSGQAAQLLFLSYSRDDERESDKLGVEYSARVGFDAAEGGMFFTSLKRISAKSGFDIPSHLSSHPDPGEREKNIPRMAEDWEQQGFEQSEKNKETFYSMIDGIMYGENPRNGYVENDTYYHPDLTFEFGVPTGFAVANQPHQVVLYNEAQDVITIFNIDAEHASAESSVKAFVSQEGISTDSETSIMANGFQGYQSEATLTSDNGKLKLLVSAVEFKGNVYRFISYTSEEKFDNYKSVFALLPDSFNEVVDQNVLNVQPARLEQIKVEQNAIFKDLLPEKLPLNIEAIDVAILNQVELDDTIEQGRIIKIPVQN